MAPPLGSGAAYTVTRLLRVEGMVYCLLWLLLWGRELRTLSHVCCVLKAWFTCLLWLLLWGRELRTLSHVCCVLKAWFTSSMAPPLGSGAAYTVTRLLRVEGMVYLYGSSSGVGS